MMEKRALIRDGAPNPSIKAGEFAAYAAKMERAFEDELARQTAAQLKN
jgi:metallo-beta-lactamase class B